MKTLTQRSRALLILLVAVFVGLNHAAVAGMASVFGSPPLDAPCLYADGRLSTANTYAGAAAQNSKVVGELFSKLMLLQTTNNDILGQMEGPEGSGKPICIKTELTKGGGDTVNFSTVSIPGGEGAIGEAALEAEQLDFGSFNLKLDIFRHGLGMTDKVRMFLAAGASIEEAFAEQEAEYFALRRQSDMFMLWRRFATAGNTLRPNDRATTDALLTGDVINTTMISDVASLLKTSAAPPCNLSKRKVDKFTADVRGFVILASDRFLTPLKSNQTYLDALHLAAERGNENIIWAGGYAKYDNQAIFHMDVVHDDTRGPIGAPIEPEALLGTALPTGTTAKVITGGGRTSPSAVHKPLKWLKGYAYPLLGYADPSADAGVYYLAIYNVTGADAGKYGIYRYTGSANDGNIITCTAHLGAANAGVAVTSLAGIAYDATKHTDAHPTGSRIVQINAKAVPYCYGLGLAAMAGLRAYGGPPIKPISEKADWGFKSGLGFQAVYSQGLCKDTQNVVRNYCLIEAAYRPQGLSNLPVVSS